MNQVFINEILESLPPFIDSLDDENINIFERQENLNKVILGLEIVANDALETCNSIGNLLKKAGLK